MKTPPSRSTRLLPILLAAPLLTACATRGQLQAVRLEHRAAILQASVDKVAALDRTNDLLGQIDTLDRRVLALENRLAGEWDRPECAYYNPAAQKAFCHRRPALVDRSFDELAAAAAREVDAAFCKQATEKWQVRAFCRDGKR